MESNQLHQVVYLSAATTPMGEKELDEILKIARCNNLAQGITGMLLYRGGQFLQVLEGPETEVLALCQKIQRDPRHNKLRIVLDGPLKARAFGSWSMGFRDLTLLKNKAEILPGFSPFLEEGFSAVECVRYPHKALRLLLAFRNTPMSTGSNSLAS